MPVRVTRDDDNTLNIVVVCAACHRAITGWANTVWGHSGDSFVEFTHKNGSCDNTDLWPNSLDVNVNKMKLETRGN